ncbi:NAD(P)/FAD-dependent oxidoreductase [Nocardia sp. BMG51109]|uniref:protoporphyrinogen/coproporphyrinogen oxidase n=1 Tax=Nocardia sp. BMG51109 TaxID=1056816 RepID=UPI0004AF47B1|nr:FAD-dependent oxidoreductase [Nocardia sp. BMG51109]
MTTSTNNVTRLDKTRKYAVVGGGVAGIAAAHELQRAGHKVELFERNPVLGGRFGVDHLGDRPVMMGGKNISRTYTELRAFLTAMGAGDDFEYFGVNTSRLIDGKLITFDSKNSRLDLVRKILRLGSPLDLLKLGILMLRIKRDDSNRFLGGATFSRIGARRDHRPLTSYFGSALANNMFRPLTVRLNGAEPDEMYLGNFNVNLSLASTFDQLTHGVQPALDEFSKHVAVRTDSPVESLVVQDGKVSGVRIAGNGKGPEQLPYDGVVVATPAYAAADIVKSEMPALSELLAEVRYFPAAVAVIEYDRPVFGTVVRAIALDGGRCSNAGVYGVNDLNIVRYTFSGRAARPMPTPDELGAWVDEAETLIKGLLGIEGELVRVHTVTRIWDAAYCAYLPFYGDFLSKVRTELSGVPGVELAGDYVKGAPLEACFRSGQEAAKRLLRRG